jgi:uncharacterized protein (TIGR02246 family)
MKILLPMLIILFVSFGVSAQNAELVLEKGVEAHREIDAIYRRFSNSYRTLDTEKVVNLYTESAAYLQLNDDLLEGRGHVREVFAPFFERMKKDELTMTISFQIFQRAANKNLAYDVGIYTLRSFKDGKEMSAGRGKFVVVAVREKDGAWRFQVDSYSGLKPIKNTNASSNF